MSLDVGPRGERRRPARALGGFELITLSVSAVGTIGIWFLQVAIVPRFALMFRDFGGELPLTTKLVVQPFAASVATLVALALAVTGAALRSTGQARTGAVLLALAALTPLVSAGLMTLALYLPVFALETGSLTYPPTP